MKILVLQLARLGDIYMTWPVLRGLRRKHPNAEIHILTRPRFEAALEGLGAVDRQWGLPSEEILSPLIENENDTETSLKRMAEFVSELRQENFDLVINLTFSPFSSYLSHAVAAGSECRTLGYTRFADGSFCPADDFASYFYSQVGLDRHNRVHVTDIMGALAEVEFIEQDWAGPAMIDFARPLPQGYVAVHIGASESHKTLTSADWQRALLSLHKQIEGLPIVLIGSNEERSKADEIAQALGSSVWNWAGELSLQETFMVLAQADLFIGGDSAPLHMASLTDTPTLNISVGNVNFWETGPKATLSFVLRIAGGETPVPERIGGIVADLLQGNLAPELIYRTSGLESYASAKALEGDFQWNLIRALYMQGPYPIVDKIEIVEGAMKLDEINSFALEQLRRLQNGQVQEVHSFLDRADEVMESISRIVPELSPLVRWFFGERVRIGPGSPEDILSATRQVHELFARHLRVYVPHEEIEEGANHGAL